MLTFASWPSSSCSTNHIYVWSFFSQPGVICWDGSSSLQCSMGLCMAGAQGKEHHGTNWGGWPLQFTSSGCYFYWAGAICQAFYSFISSFSPVNKLMKEVLLLILFYRWGIWGIESSSYLRKVTAHTGPKLKMQSPPPPPPNGGGRGDFECVSR